MGHEERERSATSAALGLVGAFFAMRSLDEEYAAMVLKVWDEQVAEEKGSPPDATRPPAHAREAARLIGRRWRYFRGRPSE